MILKVKNALARMSFLMKVMEDVLLVTFRIIGTKLHECVIHVFEPINTVKKKESVYALNSYRMIMDFNV